MVVSINPSYLCNLRCEHCYLSNKQLSDKQTIKLEEIQQHLTNISIHKEIEHIDIYGGELSLLPDIYIYSLFDICFSFTKSVNIISNGTIIKEWMYDTRIDLSFSYDGSIRDKYEQSFKNISTLNRKFHILGLVSKDFDIKEFTIHTNFLQNCETVELKPYSMSNNSIKLDLNYKFIESVKYLLQNSTKHIINEERIKRSLSKSYNAFSDNHIYITPNNKLASLEFNKNIEYFKYYDDFNHFKESWNENFSSTCKNCEYFGNCLTEHYRDNENINSCSGFYYLLKWYENNYFPIFMQDSYNFFLKNNKYDDIANDIGFHIEDLNEYKILSAFKEYLFKKEVDKKLTFPLKSIVVTSIYVFFISKDYFFKIEDILHYDIFHNTDIFYNKYSFNQRINILNKVFNNFEKEFDKIYNEDYSSFNPDIKKIVDYYKKEYNK